MRCLPVTIALLLPGCVVHERAVDVHELTSLEAVRLLVGANALSVHVELEYSSHPCVILAPDVRAVVRTEAGDLPLEILDRGGEDQGDETGSCFAMTMRRPEPPAADPASFVLLDASSEVRIDLGGMLLAPTATLVPAGPWDLRGDQPYSVTMTPRASFVQASGASVMLTLPGMPAQLLPTRLDPDAIVFRTPAVATATDATLTMRTAGPQFTSWPCVETAWNCQLVIDRRAVEQPITLVP